MTAAAQKAYDEARNEVLDLLAAIHSHTIKHDEDETIRWSHVGDMAHVAAKLTEILDFLRGDK